MSEFNGTNGKAFDYYPCLNRLRQYVEQSYSEPISLKKAPGIAALESSYFSSYFHAKVGTTFIEWLRQVRVEKAMQLMQARDLSVTEVAYEVGFGSLEAFERAFKQQACPEIERLALQNDLESNAPGRSVCVQPCCVRPRLHYMYLLVWPSRPCFGVFRRK